MWLQTELQQICIKEFALRQKLDLIQDNEYINYNLRQLVRLGVEFDSSTEGKWHQAASRCNSYWYNIIEYLRRHFLEVYDIVKRKSFLQVDPIVLRKDNYIELLDKRTLSCKSFLEICRSVTYFGQLREPISRSNSNKDLFLSLQDKCKYSDPPGNKLIPLGNRIHFIRSWIEKLVVRNQSNYTVSCWKPVPIFPLQEVSISPQKTTSINQRKRKEISVVSEIKPEFRFSKIQVKTVRLSELFDSDDSACSTSSSDSVWDPPFKAKGIIRRSRNSALRK